MYTISLPLQSPVCGPDTPEVVGRVTELEQQLEQLNTTLTDVQNERWVWSGVKGVYVDVYSGKCSGYSLQMKFGHFDFSGGYY